jgi:uncharacterized protein YigE (DUF2233 family)
MLPRATRRGLIVASALAACTQKSSLDDASSHVPVPARVAAPVPVPVPAPVPVPVSAPCTTDALPLQLAAGLHIQRLKSPVASPVGIGDGCVTIVRVDPALHRLRLLNAATHGQRNRTAEQWATEFGLTGVINASMYRTDGRSVGLMINGAATNQEHDDKRQGGFLAFDPVRAGNPTVQAVGRECANVDLLNLRRDYRVVFQNYRLLDCEARPIRWKDPKVFSAAAIGVGNKGDFVLIHSRTPYTMTEFATVLALPALDLAQAMYVEGGPEASLYLHAGGATIRATGSYESGFRTNDDNREFWEIPNVIGISPL